MAIADIVTLVLQAQVNAYIRDLAKARSAYGHFTSATIAQSRAMERSVAASMARVGAAARITGSALAAVVAGGELRTYVDTWLEARNRIAATGIEGAALAATMSDIVETAQATRTGFDATSRLMARMLRGTEGIKASYGDVLKTVTAVNQAFKAGGATTMEQEAGILQLSQALGSGFLQGDELRTLRESAPLVARAIAEAMGTSIAGLKKLGAEGKLTSDVVFKAILDYADEIRERFERTTPTIADAFTVLRNGAIEGVAKLDEATGASQAFIKAILTINDNLETTAQVAAVAGAALLTLFTPTLVAGGLSLAGSLIRIGATAGPIGIAAAAIAAMTAYLVTFGDEIKVVEGELATLEDYGAVAFHRIGAEAGRMYETIRTQVNDAIKVIIDAMSDTVGSTEDLMTNIITVLSLTINQLQYHLNAFRIHVEDIPRAVASAAIETLNRMTGIIAQSINGLIQLVNRGVAAINQMVPEHARTGPGGRISEVDLSIDNPFAETGTRDARIEAARAEAFAENEVENTISRFKQDIADLREQANIRANFIAAGRSLQGLGPDVDADPRRGAFTSAAGLDAVTNDAATKAAKERADEYERILDMTEKNIDALFIEANTIGMGTREATAYTAEMEMLNAAREAGIDLTPEEREQIRSLAEAYGFTAEQVEKLTTAYERQQEILKDIRDTMSESLKGFINDLREGESVMQSLSNIADRISRKFSDMAVDEFMNLLMGSSTPSGPQNSSGAIGQWLASLVGAFAGGGTSTPASWGGLRAEGGPVVPNKAYLVGEGGKPEIFMPSQPGSIIPMSRAGMTVHVPVSIDARGADASAVIRVESAVRQLEKSLPQMITIQSMYASNRRTR